MRGKCAFADCLVGDDEELTVAACTSCKNPVHHMCSNAVHEGALDIRVCSHRCAEALGLTNQQSSSNAVPTSRVVPKQSGKGGKSEQAKTKTDGTAKRKRGGSIKTGTQPHTKAKDTSSYKPKATSTKSRRPPVKKTLKKGEEVVEDDGDIPESDSAVELANGVLKKAKTSGSTITSTQGKRSAVRKTSGMQSTTGGSEGSALLESCSSNDIDSTEDGRCGSDVGSDADGDEPNRKPKKFYFTPAKDLDLLMEVLNVRPYAAEHGCVSERYEVVTSNLNEHRETELCVGTVKERFFRHVKEFKATDCAYRKKSGVEEEYTEHKRLLQDVVDELKGVEAKKKKKKAGQQAKSDRLESDGERLREQALKRRSQRGASVQSGEVARDNDDESADETSERSSDAASSTTTTSTRGSGYHAGGGLTTAQVNAATVEFIEKQSKRHEDEYQLLREELRFKQTKAEMEEARWKEEFEFRKREAEANAKTWSEEIDLRRSDMELGREELALLKYQLNLPPILNPSTQANA